MTQFVSDVVLLARSCYGDIKPGTDSSNFPGFVPLGIFDIADYRGVLSLIIGTGFAVMAANVPERTRSDGNGRLTREPVVCGAVPGPGSQIGNRFITVDYYTGLNRFRNFERPAMVTLPRSAAIAAFCLFQFQVFPFDLSGAGGAPCVPGFFFAILSQSPRFLFQYPDVIDSSSI